MKAGGTPPKIPSVGEPRMRGRLAVRCPKCGAAPGFRCLYVKPGRTGAVTTAPKNTPHHERKAGTPYGRADASFAPALAAHNRTAGDSIQQRREEQA